MFNYKNYKFNPQEYEVFCGLDTSKKSISVTFVSWNETANRSLKIPYSSGALLNYVRRHFPDKRIAFVYEAGPTGFGLYDDLTAAGYFSMVTSPSMVLKAPGDKVKTNRLDSRKLAEQLRGGNLKAVHVPTGSYRQLRHLTQLRKSCVKRQTAAKLQIKSLFLVEGMEFPKNNKGKLNWGSSTLEFLRGWECTSAIRFKLDRLLWQLQFWHQEVLQTQREIKCFCKEDPELRGCVLLLITVPGIGETIAVHLLSRIGDWRSIRNSRQLAAFFGLIPSEDSTGERINRGAITRMGDRHSRALLIESAWVAIRKDRELHDCYRRIFNANNEKKEAKKKAIVAVARRLTTRIYAVLSQQRPYRLSKEV